MNCNRFSFTQESVTELTSAVNSVDEFGTDLSSMGKERNSIPLLWQERLSSTSPNSSFSAAVKEETTTSIPARCNKLMSSGSQSCPLGRGIIARLTPSVFIQ